MFPSFPFFSSSFKGEENGVDGANKLVGEGDKGAEGRDKEHSC